MNLKQIKQLRAGITDGPIEVKKGDVPFPAYFLSTNNGEFLGATAHNTKMDKANAEFWAAAPEIVDWLVDKLNDLEADRDHQAMLYERFRSSEGQLSAAYVRLRRILGTLDIRYEGIADMWAITEKAASELKKGADDDQA